MGIVAGTLFVAALIVWARLDAWLDLKKLERQTKRHLNAAELQQWATNLLTRHWAQHQRWEEYYGPNFYNSTNFPSDLRKVGCFSDGMRILIDTQQRDVAVFGTTKGGPWLQVGAPSLAAPTNQTFIQWKPGIYFVRAVLP